MDHGRDPCPWVILNDFGGAFSMGVRLPEEPTIRIASELTLFRRLSEEPSGTVSRASATVPMASDESAR